MKVAAAAAGSPSFLISCALTPNPAYLFPIDIELVLLFTSSAQSLSMHASDITFATSHLQHLVALKSNQNWSGSFCSSLTTALKRSNNDCILWIVCKTMRPSHTLQRKAHELKPIFSLKVSTCILWCLGGVYLMMCCSSAHQHNCSLLQFQL